MYLAYDEKLNGKLLPKRDQPFAININCEELIVIKDDNSCTFFFVTQALDAYALEDKQSKKKATLPGTVYFQVFKPKDPDKEQTKAVLWEICSSRNWEGKYKGWLYLTDNYPAAGMLLGKPDFLAEMAKEAFKLTEIDACPTLEALELTPTRYQGKASFETVSQRFEKRIEILREQGKEIADSIDLLAATAGLSKMTDEMRIEIVLTLLN